MNTNAQYVFKQVLTYYSETGVEVCISYMISEKEETERWVAPKAILPR